jgi:hypothetical protein
MKKLLFAIVAIAMSIAMPAQAQFGHILLPPRNANQGYETGLDVLRLCVAPEETELLQCLGFLEATNDIFVKERADAGLPPCYPEAEKVDLVALQRTLIAYLIAHPERRPELGSRVVRAAITARWCTAGSRP